MDFLRLYSLIETWDVLKSLPQWQNPARWLFNRNMGCIEMWLGRSTLPAPCSLIETWDVLKYRGRFSISSIHPGLIETWDVLKSCNRPQTFSRHIV